jgi:hypothetical protein
MLHHGQIVRDEKQGEAEFLLEILKEIHNLGLNAHVEGTDWFIADDELWFDRECPCDADPLTLPATKLVWVAGRHLGLQSHVLEQGLDAVATFTCSQFPKMDLKSLSNDGPDGHPGIQGSERILKDVLDLPAEGAELLLAEGKDILPLPENLTGGGWDQFDDGAADRCFSASAFTDQSHGFAGLHRETNSVDRLEVTGVASKDSAVNGKIDPQVPDLEQRCAGVHSRHPFSRRERKLAGSGASRRARSDPGARQTREIAPRTRRYSLLRVSGIAARNTR